MTAASILRLLPTPKSARTVGVITWKLQETNMDLEKIREAFERWVDSAYNVPKDEFKAINADTHASTVNGYFVPFYAGYKAALSIIDPDAIRRECADRAVEWQVKLCADDDWTCERCTECNQLRNAIMGNIRG